MRFPALLLGAGVAEQRACRVGDTLRGLCATFRARVLSRWAAGALITGWVLAPASALLPNELRPLVAVPIGFALAWLGYALWSERRAQASENVPGTASPLLSHTGAE